MKYGALFVSLVVCVFMLTAGCANPSADDWHKFQTDTMPMQGQLQRMTSAWQQLDTMGAAVTPAARYQFTIRAIDGSILPALKSALANLDKAHPHTAEVQSVQTRYGEALARLEISAQAMRSGMVALQKGKTRDGNQRMADSKDELHRALAALREASLQETELNRRYGSARS